MMQDQKRKQRPRKTLQEIQPLADQLDSGVKTCDIGILSTWIRTVITRVTDRGRQSGILPGDKIISVNGDEFNRDNYARVRSRLSAGDAFSIRVSRDGDYIDLVGECGDLSNYDRAYLAMIGAASKGKWEACISSSIEIDRINAKKTASTAYWRNGCSEAMRCSARRCKNVTPKTGAYLYDFQSLAIEEVGVIGQLDQWRSNYLFTLDWLTDSGFHRFATELESDWRKAESPDTSKSVSRFPETPSRTAFGTCFAVSSTEVVTSHHVVAEADLITISFPGATEALAIVDHQSQSTDLAVLKISGKAPAILPLAPMRSLKVGEEIFTLGYPVTEILGIEPKFTEGSVSSLSGLKDDASYFQMSVPVQPGNSGGPVMNMRGEVVGVVASTAAIQAFFASSGSLPQNINWASKSDYVRLMLTPQQ